jgi:hypothetical protein
MMMLIILFGFALTMFMAFMWMGLPFLVAAIIKGPTERQLSAFSLSSVPAVINSRTVEEFIQTLKNDDKRGAYNQVWSNMRKLLMDITKHRDAYPADINELKAFTLTQLRYNIEHSPVRESMETSKFRDLAEEAVKGEVMHDIHLADCRANRAPIISRISDYKNLDE